MQASPRPLLTATRIKGLVRPRLAEDDPKPWLRKMWCMPQVDSAFVARMEDALDLYAEGADRSHPVVCFDESPTQLIGEVRKPIPAAPGQLERYDCEYWRNGDHEEVWGSRQTGRTTKT